MADAEGAHEETEPPSRGHKDKLDPEAHRCRICTVYDRHYQPEAVITNHDQVVHAKDAHVESEVQEKLCVLEADTVCQPLAVVVHAEDTATTRATVVRPGRLCTPATHLALAHKLLLDVEELLLVECDLGAVSVHKIVCTGRVVGILRLEHHRG